ncbi:hypothetical protein HPB48_006598 [Haemaphysalis longicornis]|uniref:Uncharacterized protein n=1 Tax=Haemaphysalis longicornis TaxID=44386 RepID=A0A9J6GNZ1_HAELO|nr:hypothetical protein HPB48_006598 [Haemaphysalis longicornis]
MNKNELRSQQPPRNIKKQEATVPSSPTPLSSTASHFSTYHSITASLLVIAIAGLYEVHRLCTSNNALLTSLSSARADFDPRPVVWVYSKSPDRSHLHHVIEVFREYGYRIGERTDSWSVLWSHEYPFTELAPDMRELKASQAVNHFPGSGYITNKASLSTDRSIQQLPLTFKLPAQKHEFVRYVSEHPSAMWVQKDRDHRGIRVVEPSEVAEDGDIKFVQELISNPLLIDGKKFDIGVYVVMTSLEPLRVYVYRGDVLLRFCARPYNAHQFNASDLDSYVIGDDYTPVWEVPSLARYYVASGLSMKASLDAYLRAQLGADSGALWAELERAVATVYERKAASMRSAASRWSRGRFFELVRFDFVLDEALGVHLLEANMSPNLSSAHFAANGPFYEQLLMSMLGLVGLGTPRAPREDDGWRFLDRATSVLPEDCLQREQDCRPPTSLCSPGCLSAAHRKAFAEAFWEHLNRKQFARLVPRPDGGADPEANLTDADRIMSLWFRAKCAQDSDWCY